MSLRRVLQLTLAVLVGSLFWSLASPAGAIDNPDYTSPPPSTVVTTPVPAQKVSTQRATPAARTRLAITGSDATGTVVLGIGLVAVGAGVLAVRRRRVTASPTCAAS